MKQIKFMAFCLAAAMMSCGLTACSDDDDNDDNGGGNGSAANVKPESVFTAGLPTSIDGAAITTNSQGQVTSITYSETFYKESYKFIYEPVNFKGKKYDATVEFTETYGRADEPTYRFYVRLNKQGFVTYAYQEYVGEDDSDEWWFTYNKDGQLNSVKRSESAMETTITYTDSNITKVSTIERDDDDTTPDVVTISYINGANTTPIPNKGGIMLFDATFDVDLDEFEAIYYAGMLGKPTKNLPLVQTDVTDAGYYLTYDWTLNSNGLPVSMTTSYFDPDGQPTPDPEETYTFGW